MSYPCTSEARGATTVPGPARKPDPGTSGFVITLSVTPPRTYCRKIRPDHATSVLAEYFWTGHADDSEYIRLVFKFGSGVDEAFKERVIEAVTRGAGGPGSPPHWHRRLQEMSTRWTRCSIVTRISDDDSRRSRRV